jgi:predicted porin
MKKTLIALAALASTAAFAQNVTLSGSVGFAYQRATAGGDAQLGNSDVTQNTILLSGSEDLGGGLKANFYMQQRFDGTTGANINAADRGLQNIFAGLSGGFGTVQVGRFSTPGNGGYDAFGQFGTFGDYAGLGPVGTRNDRTVQYASPSIMGLSGSVAFTLDNANVGSEYFNLRVSYAAGPLAASYAQERNASTTAAKGTKDWEAGVSYDLGVAKLMVNVGDLNGVRDASIGARVPMGAAALKLQGRTGDSASSFALGADYALSKRTMVYGDLGTVSGANQSAFRFGLKHSF